MNLPARNPEFIPKQRAWTVKSPIAQKPRPRVQNVITRRYEIHWLGEDGAASCSSVVAPALPVFEQAFSSFAQGTLIQTTDGYVAVEDLQPGDMLATADGGNLPLLWIGSMTMYPQQTMAGLPEAHLYRVCEGGYGLDRSAPDLILGPSARLLPGLFAIDSSSPLCDIDDLADGSSVIRIRPVSPVRVFHLALGRHGLVRANGVLTESFHPGRAPQMRLSHEMFDIYMSLFPHVRELSDFGSLRHARND